MGRGTDVTDERKVLNSIPFRQNKCTQREMAEMFNVFQTTVARKLRENFPLPSRKIGNKNRKRFAIKPHNRVIIYKL